MFSNTENIFISQVAPGERSSRVDWVSVNRRLRTDLLGSDRGVNISLNPEWLPRLGGRQPTLAWILTVCRW